MLLQMHVVLIENKTKTSTEITENKYIKNVKNILKCKHNWSFIIYLKFYYLL